MIYGEVVYYPDSARELSVDTGAHSPVQYKRMR